MKRYALLAATTVVGGAFAFQGSVNLQATTPGTAQTGNLHITGTAKAGVFEAISTAPTGLTYGGDFRSASSSGRGVLGNASSTTGATYGGLFQVASNAGRAVAGIAGSTSGTTYGGFFSSLSNQGRGVYGQATAASGTTYGVYGKATSANGYGVYSEGRMHATGVISGNGSGLTNVNAAQLGGFASSAYLRSIPVPLNLSGGSSEVVLFVENTNAGFSSTQGVYAIANSSSSSGVLGISNGSSGRGVFGVANGGGTSFGGDFQAYGSDTDTSGVRGLAYSVSGITYGVWGQSQSSTGYGTIGIANSSTGVTYGLYGRTTSPAGFAVFAQGNSSATGTKAFRIDHPFDPENKYLLHYSSESPTPQNFYVGNVMTDANGRAWVELPDYFSEINKNFKYQLTVISEDFVQAVVSKKAEGNRFQIRTSAPNTEVSWRVDADRNDLYVRNRPPKDVIAKEGPEKGTYQHPEFYGLGAERGLLYHAPEKSRRDIKPSAK